MSRRLLVIEKTLELNLCAEMLNSVRGQRGCGEAFWVGLTQGQESRHGFDERLANVPPGRQFLTQFKAPARQKSKDGEYIFAIDRGQHARLLRIAKRMPGRVFYVLPCINTWSELCVASPSLGRETFLLDVGMVQRLPGRSKLRGLTTAKSMATLARIAVGGTSQRKHRLFVDSSSGVGVLHSEPIEVPIQRWAYSHLESELFSPNAARENDLLDSVRKEARRPFSRPGRWGRELHALVVPEGRLTS